MAEDIAQTADLLKAVADKNRLKIINLLSCGKMCVCKITENLELSQPNISHHLRVLKKAGLIKGIKRGKWVDYQLNKEKLEQMQLDLEQIIAEKDCDLEIKSC